MISLLGEALDNGVELKTTMMVNSRIIKQKEQKLVIIILHIQKQKVGTIKNMGHLSDVSVEETETALGVSSRYEVHQGN